MTKSDEQWTSNCCDTVFMLLVKKRKSFWCDCVHCTHAGLYAGMWNVTWCVTSPACFEETPKSLGSPVPVTPDQRGWWDCTGHRPCYRDRWRKHQQLPLMIHLDILYNVKVVERSLKLKKKKNLWEQFCDGTRICQRGKGLWRIKVLWQGYVQVSLKKWFNATCSTVKMFMIINQSP